MTNQELGIRIASDDENAFAAFYESNRAWVYRRSLLMLGCPQDAAEAVQDAMMQVWSVRHQYNAARGSFSTWIGVVIQNQLTAVYHKKQRDARKHIGDLIATDTETDRIVAMPDTYHADAADALVISEQMKKIEDALCKMPAHEQRLAFVLYHFEGYSFARVAKIMNRSAPWIRTLVRQATRHLREVLTDPLC